MGTDGSTKVKWILIHEGVDRIQLTHDCLHGNPRNDVDCRNLEIVDLTCSRPRAIELSSRLSN